MTEKRHIEKGYYMTVVSNSEEYRENRNEDEEKSVNIRKKIFENRKESRSYLFPMALNKIEEVDETKSTETRDENRKIVADENGKLKIGMDDAKHTKLAERKSTEVMKKCEDRRQRPKSAISSTNTTSLKENLKKRPKSSCALSGESFRLELARSVDRNIPKPKSASFKFFEIRGLKKGCRYWNDIDDKFNDLPEPEENYSRPSTTCGIGTGSCMRTFEDYFMNTHENWMIRSHHHTSGYHRARKCKSVPNFSRMSVKSCQKIFHDEKDFNKFKRSLKLLGFEPSDFGICAGRTEIGPRWKPKKPSSTFSTKIFNRSVSLDSLREAVREAWMEDRLDVSHRRLMAQAAYEEWYFKKEEQVRKKRQEDKMKKIKIKENITRDFQKKKAKAEEEFRKWIQRKQIKRNSKDKKNMVQAIQDSFSKLVKTKEESEKAFLKWKKEKDKHIKEREKLKKEEEEKQIQFEIAKKEKREVAEKAFQEWKTKLEENQKIEAKKQLKLQIKQKEMERRRKKEEGNQTSFQAWKLIKDEEIMKRTKQVRHAAQIARKERLTQMEERMYEAEQAFEDWLEKTDLKKQKQLCNIEPYQKNIPWLPT